MSHFDALHCHSSPKYKFLQIKIPINHIQLDIDRTDSQFQLSPCWWNKLRLHESYLLSYLIMQLTGGLHQECLRTYSTEHSLSMSFCHHMNVFILTIIPDHLCIQHLTASLILKNSNMPGEEEPTVLADNVFVNRITMHYAQLCTHCICSCS